MSTEFGCKELFIAGLSVDEIHEASAKVLADPGLHRFFNWSAEVSRHVGREIERESLQTLHPRQAEENIAQLAAAIGVSVEQAKATMRGDPPGITVELEKVMAYATNRAVWRRKQFPDDQTEADRMEADIAAVREQYGKRS